MIGLCHRNRPWELFHMASKIIIFPTAQYLLLNGRFFISPVYFRAYWQFLLKDLQVVIVDESYCIECRGGDIWWRFGVPPKVRVYHNKFKNQKTYIKGDDVHVYYIWSLLLVNRVPIPLSTTGMPDHLAIKIQYCILVIPKKHLIILPSCSYHV